MPTAKDILCCKWGCVKKVSNGIVAGLETVFFKLGGLVGRHPWKTIGMCVLVCGLMGIGLMKFREEGRYIKTFLPRGSRIHAEHDWIEANFPGVRAETLIIEDKNVLSAQSINAIFDIYETAHNFTTKDGHTFADLCVRIGASCQVSSILELWLYNESVIRNLTDADVYNTVNQDTINRLVLRFSPLYQAEIYPEKFLGHIRRNNESKIIGASATRMIYLLEGNETIKGVTMDWEKQIITFVNDVGHAHLQKLYIYAARTYDDEAMGTLYSDLKLLFSGFCLVFFYLTFSIGQLSLVHHRVMLSLAGLISIGLAICFAYGFAFLTEIMFGIIHQVLPFMLLGIGVDDIFVIIESLNNLTPKQRALPVEGRIAFTLQNAGVSITVTSITDIVTFGIGSTTVIPALSTFCVYAAIGVFALYVIQATFFVACLALDEKRKEARRDACLLCCKHRNTYRPNENYKFSVQHHLMKKVLAPILTNVQVKALVIVLFLGLTSLNIWSFMHIKFDYIPGQYLPTDSYSSDFAEADQKFFPDHGAHVKLYCGEMDYAKNVDAFFQLYEMIKNNPSVQPHTVDFWLISYQAWLNATTSVDLVISSIHEEAIKTSILMDDNFEIDANATINLIRLLSNSSNDIPYRTAYISSTPEPYNSSSNYSETIGSSSSDDLTELYLTESLLKTSPNSSANSSEELTFTEATTLYNNSFSNASDLLNVSDDQTSRFVSSICQFLQTPLGLLYERAVRVDCFSESPTIKGSVFTFNHVKCHSSQCDIDAMNIMRTLVDSFTFHGGGTCFVYSDPQYMYNETNEVLRVEFLRNLALAAVSVFVVTLILITNIWTSILVFLCVVCTVIDVAGTMQFWDISVDMASSVILILCFGLAVDYSAHIGHSFMTTKGSKNERLRKTLCGIGPAVLSGGVSTFLAFSLLYFTSSYGFVLFFRIFTSVVIFGLFHGLVFLPVILSVIGPPPYETHTSREAPPRHSDTARAMLPHSNGEVMREIRHSPTIKDYDDSVFCNGNVWISISDLDFDKDSRKSPKSPRYSGSYYEQLSNGSWEEIPYQGKR